MTKLFHFGRLASLPAGAVVLLLAMVLVAPPSARGGCSHLVTSQTERGRHPSLMDDLSGGKTGRSDPLSPPPRPCSGAWCSGQPAAPSVPPGELNGRAESWACCALIPAPTAITSSFISIETSVPRPVCHGKLVFHPPRLLLSA